MIEEFMQLLVGIVYAQLFKRIDCEIFKSENVQYAQESTGILSGIYTIINVIDEPGECSRIQRFSHCMSVFTSLQNK